MGGKPISVVNTVRRCGALMPRLREGHRYVPLPAGFGERVVEQVAMRGDVAVESAGQRIAQT